jgi:hypothetical protein
MSEKPGLVFVIYADDYERLRERSTPRKSAQAVALQFQSSLLTVHYLHTSKARVPVIVNSAYEVFFTKHVGSRVNVSDSMGK